MEDLLLVVKKGEKMNFYSFVVGGGLLCPYSEFIEIAKRIADEKSEPALAWNIKFIVVQAENYNEAVQHAAYFKYEDGIQKYADPPSVFRKDMDLTMNDNPWLRRK